MKELLEKKCKEAEDKFTKLHEKLKEIEENQKKLVDAHVTVTDELKRLQGEYRGYKDLLDSAVAEGNGGESKEGGRILEAKVGAGK